ncbi:UNVERIFIED_CONTAM: hypothetical protein PYX00_000032 [Menopon gallinae]|uniref:lysozyme n=1 Tax=Menopon gallinae TaxID=328185 RepID=A0AAW2I8L4_9NEOP
METKTLAILLFLFVASAWGKTYERCELARELKNVHGVTSMRELATWVCIAYHESRYKTDAVNRQNPDGSADYGIFQINNRYWCSPPGTGCKITCQSLLTDSIKEDFKCSKKVFAEHQKISGDGFTAWTTYKYCKGSAADKFIEGCF